MGRRMTVVLALGVAVVAASVLFGQPAAGASSCHLAGTWSQNTDGLGSSDWTIAADGKATESGLAGAKGTATLSGDVLTIETVVSDPSYNGTYRWMLGADCSGSGTLTFKNPPRAGEQHASHVRGPAPTTTPPPSGPCGPSPLSGPFVTLSQAQRKVEVQRSEAGWEPATQGLRLICGDRVHTGFKAGVVLTFPDGSRLLVGDMTMVQLTDVGLGPQGGVRVRVLLNTGSVTAQVNRSTGASGDFQVKTPTTTASVRGTVFSVRFDGSATTVAVTESSVQVTANNGATANIPAGMETRSTATSVAAPALIGHGFTSGGLTDTQAIALVSGKIAKGLSRCKLGVVSNRLSPVTGGWNIGLVIVRASQGIAAKPKGTANFRLARTRIKPGNKLAKRIAAACR
jgi:hypothetical protein